MKYSDEQEALRKKLQDRLVVAQQSGRLKEISYRELLDRNGYVVNRMLINPYQGINAPGVPGTKYGNQFTEQVIDPTGRVHAATKNELVRDLLGETPKTSEYTKAANTIPSVEGNRQGVGYAGGNTVVIAAPSMEANRQFGEGKRPAQHTFVLHAKDKEHFEKLVSNEQLMAKLSKLSGQESLPQDIQKAIADHRLAGNKKLAALGLGAVGLMGLIAAMNQKDPKEELQKKQIVEDMKRKREQMGYYQ